MKLRDIGEDRLLQQLLGKLVKKRGVVLGPGDDCAVVESGKRGVLQLLKTDCLVAGIHFAKNSRPEEIGWKAMARPVSDFAAMSGVPEFALVTLVVAADTELQWVKRLYRGIEKAARVFGVAVVGGETSNTKGQAVISVSVTGHVEKKRWVGRAGGKPGDDLFVTGRLGGSLRGHHLKFVPRLAEARWLTKHFRVHAMMDLSDGLGADLPRLARASKVGFVLDRRALPLNRDCTVDDAISNGEDYELLFAIAARDRKRLEKSWAKKFPRLPLTRIGGLNRKASSATVATAAGSKSLLRHSGYGGRIENRKLPGGYVHFR